MTTKPPSTVQEFPSESLEKIAYASVSTIPTQEPNDRTRLGYHVWRWLTTKQGTLDEAVRESGARLNIAEHEAINIIRQDLQKRNISIS